MTPPTTKPPTLIPARVRAHALTVCALILMFSSTTRGEDLRPLAAELGITPESLIVAEIHSQADTLLSRLDLATEERQLLQSQRQAAAQKSNEISALQNQLADDPDNETLQYNLAVALTQLANLDQQIAATLDDLRDLVFEGVAQSAQDRLATWLMAARHAAPDEFGVLSLTDAQWRSVRQALRAENRALRRGRTLEDEHAEVLKDIREYVGVIAAKQRLDAHLVNVTIVFDQYAE